MSFAPGRSSLLHARIVALVAGCSAASCSQYDTSIDGGDSAGAARIGRAVPTSPFCDTFEGYSKVAGLRLPNPVDYLAWDSYGQPVEEVGTLCGFAEASDICSSAVATARAGASANAAADTSYSNYYLYTRGDDVGLLVSEQEILEFLGPVDTVNEAAIVLSLRYRAPGCNEISTVDDGYVTGPRYLSRTISPETLGDCEIIGYRGVHVSYDGTTSERDGGSGLGVCPGRRPARLLETSRPTSNHTPGAYFARVAELELAAVAAFAELERALVAHCAPAGLIDRCRAARRDEIRHAALMTELACRYGAVPQPVRFVPKASHTLLELALENAWEGTSRELFGAVVAAWQSRTADAAGTRACFADIARDEAEHAQFSLDLAAWLSERLTSDDRARVARERERSFQELEKELAVEVHDELRLVAGVPGAADAQRLLGAVRAELA